MPNSEDYRKYLESQFEHVNEKLDSIHDHVKQTNGRVSKLEDELEDVRLTAKDHELSCALKGDVKELQELIKPIEVIRKNWLIAVIGIIGFIGLTFSVAFKNLIEIFK